MKRAIPIFIVMLLAWRAFLLLGPEKASDTELFLVSLIYFISCIPLLVYFLRSEKNIPYLPVFGIIYFIYFGLSIFNGYDLFLSEHLSQTVVLQCLNLVLFGFISLLFAFYTPLGKIADLTLKPLKLNWDLHKAYRLGIFVGFVGIVVYYIKLTTIFPSAVHGLLDFITSLSRLGVVILFMLQLQKKLNFNGRIILWFGLFIPRIFLDLVTGATFSIILDFMILLFLYFYHFKAIPWLPAIAALLIFVVIFSARDTFREMTWFGGEYTNATPLQKGTLYIKLIYERLSGEKKEYQQTYEKLSSRTDSLVTFAKIVELTPRYIPYWGGYTYSTLWTSLIPRFIMPDKPEKTLGQEFGHRYALLDSTDFSTSYNLPIPVEFYINFGQWGIIIGMFILGLIFRIGYNLFNHWEAGEGGIIISAMIFTNLLTIEGDFSLVFGGIIQYTILFYIITKRMKLSIKATENTS